MVIGPSVVAHEAYRSASAPQLGSDSASGSRLNRVGGLGFSQDTHACAGRGLARLGLAATLRALGERVERVERVERTGPPTWSVNNIIHRHDRLPITLVGV